MSVAFVDTETLGLDPVRHPIWEIAIIVDDVEHCWQVEVLDFHLENAQPEALAISRFHERYDATTAYTRRDSAERVEKLLAGRQIVGAVPSFDEERLRRLCNCALRGGLPPEGRYPWHYRPICVESMMLARLRGAGEIVDVPWKSHELSVRCGVPNVPAEEHTALGDARWAKAIYERCSTAPMLRRECGWCGLPGGIHVDGCAAVAR